MRATDQLTLSADVIRVAYSQLVTSNFRVIDFGFTSAPPRADQYYVDDATEVRAGAEWQWRHDQQSVWLRAGVFTDPPHGLRYSPEAATFGGNVENYSFNVNARTSTRVGRTVGAGWAWSDRWQLDAAASFVTDASHALVSLTYRVR